MEWNERVIAECPPERLLVFNPSEGWEPLCRFLGVPVPTEPFPHDNDGDYWVAERLRSRRMGGAVLHGKRHHLDACEEYCLHAPCSELKGNPDIECAACPATHACWPGAQGFGPGEEDLRYHDEL